MEIEIDLEYVKNNIDNLQNNRWLFVSSLQKCIRRGLHKEASQLWDVCKELNKFHATYRTSIIAIEDIGLGNPELVYDFLSTSLKKNNLIEKGGDEYIKNIVIELAKSIKDRTACDASWLAGKLSPPMLDNQSLTSYYKDPGLSVIERTVAGWLLTGTKKIKHEFITEKDSDSNIEDFVTINKDLGVDDKTLEIITCSYPYQKEPHLFAYPLLTLEFKKDLGKKIGTYNVGDFFEPKIESPVYYYRGIPILLAAVDGHTSEGKNVLGKVKQLTVIKKIIGHLSGDTQEYLLKHALFKAEGQVVNKRLLYPAATAIYQKSQNFYKEVELFKELTKEIQNILPQIHNIRENVLDYKFKNSYKSKI